MQNRDKSRGDKGDPKAVSHDPFQKRAQEVFVVDEMFEDAEWDAGNCGTEQTCESYEAE
jgi:hypothetical protein